MRGVANGSATSNGMNLISLSLGANILEASSAERARMHRYAEKLGSLHIVVATRDKKWKGYEAHEENLHLIGAYSATRVGVFIATYRKARELYAMHKAPSLVTAQDPFFLGLLAYLLTKFRDGRFHLQVHGDYFDSLWRKGHPEKYALQFLALFLMRRASGVRVASMRIKQSLVRRGIPHTSITVLPIRPQLEKFLRMEHTIRDIGPLTFLTVGRLAPEKNLILMLRAFKVLLSNEPGHTLRIVGKGSEEMRLRACVHELSLDNSVTFVPWTEHVEEEMAKADVYLLASLHEAYALVLLEALATGLPVVTTDVGCVGELVKNGAHGLVVPPGDLTAYAQALIRITREREKFLMWSKNGRQTAEQVAQQRDESYTDAWVAAHSSL